jgi:hypothetical protein
MLSTIVSASSSDSQSRQSVAERVGIIPAAALVRPSAASESAAVSALRRRRAQVRASAASSAVAVRHSRS